MCGKMYRVCRQTEFNDCEFLYQSTWGLSYVETSANSNLCSVSVGIDSESLYACPGTGGYFQATGRLSDRSTSN